MPDLAPYTPSLYLPGNFGRYRSYPRRVRTPIPGAGYDATLVWAEQPLNLWGVQRGIPATRYGRYAPAPLLGLGQNAAINRELGWSKSAMKKYWDARAQQCTMMADEGQCLARVARHVPVTIGSYYQEGVGQTSMPTRAASQFERLIMPWGAWPEGNPMLTAPMMADGTTHVMPVSDALNMLKYQVVAAGVGAWIIGWGMGYWWRGRRMKANRRRRMRMNRRGRR